MYQSQKLVNSYQHVSNYLEDFEECKVQMNNLKFRFYHRFKFTTVHMGLGFKKADESSQFP